MVHSKSGGDIRLSLAETRDRALNFAREMDYMRWFPLLSSPMMFSVTHEEFELKTPVLFFCMLNDYTTALPSST